MAPPALAAIEGAANFCLRNATVPSCLLAPDLPADANGLAAVDIVVADGRIAALAPAGAGTELPAAQADLDAGMVWPGFVDAHTHLDKGHIWDRTPNPDGSRTGALISVRQDREAHWRAEDVEARMEFGLRCAYAHGSTAIRTHIDSMSIRRESSWRVFRERRDAWRGRIELQASSLIAAPEILADDDDAIALADLVAESGGVFGAVTYGDPAMAAALDRLISLAAERGLDLDFHVDENLDPNSRSFIAAIAALRRHDFQGRVVFGHCCSLSTWPDADLEAALRAAAESGIAIVSLPMCNMYLQDRAGARTPRRRGVTVLHEIAGAGIPFAIASDNCRDPFYAYGDHDMAEVFQQAVRIGHLDHPIGAWPRAVTTAPAAIIGAGNAAGIAPGAPADLVLFSARRYSELLARPQADRAVLRAGRPIDTGPPDYRELDDVIRGKAA